MPGSIKDCSSRIDQTPSPPFTTPLSINTAKWNTKLEPVNPRQKEERTCYKLGTMDQGGRGPNCRELGTAECELKCAEKKSMKKRQLKIFAKRAHQSLNIASYFNKSSFSKIPILYIYVFFIVLVSSLTCSDINFVANPVSKEYDSALFYLCCYRQK